MSDFNQTAVAFLAGGQSTRMGFAKPLLTIDGQTFLQRHSRAFCGFSQTILSSNDSRIALRGATRAPDLFTCIGPLGGIHAVLTASHCERVVLVPCDMPFLTPDIAHQLLAHASGTLACVAQVGGQLEPLGCGVYSKSALPIVEKCIAQGQYKLRTVLDRLDAAVVPLSENQVKQAFLNINTPTDYAQYCAKGGTP